MNNQEKKLTLQIARFSLKSYLTENKEPDTDIIREKFLAGYPSDSIFFKPHGCFTTLKRKSGTLRGCMGFIKTENALFTNIVSTAVLAGTADDRFTPVTLSELDDLEMEFSCISPMEKTTNLENIKVGTHGLLIVKGHKQGLLLPQVGIEYNWDRTTFLQQTCIKAGLPPQAFLDNESIVYCFTAEVFKESQIDIETDHAQ